MDITFTPKTPMLAKAPKAGARVPAHWVLEPKLDGHRVLAHVTHDDVRLYARSGVDKTVNMPCLARALEALPEGTVLDGEMVSLDRTGGDWAKVQSVLGSSSRTDEGLTFVAFDVLFAMGQDVRGYPATERRAFLATLLAHATEAGATNVALSPQVPYSPEAVQTLLDAGWEGAILKNPAARYQSGRRSEDWTKIKMTDTVDVIITGATDGEGKYVGLIGALTFGAYDAAGTLVHVGKCSGMTDAQRVAFSDMREQGTLAGHVIEVQHMGVMPTGGLRHPQYLRTRTDKPAAECTLEGIA